MAVDRKILNLRFNQDQGCFSCSMETGVRIYNVEPLMELNHLDVDVVGSVTSSEMLYRTNLVALLSGGTRPVVPDNVLRIYDDLQKKLILEMAFSAPIKAVRIRHEKLVVILQNRIHVFSFPSPLKQLFSWQTISNPRGLCELSPLSAIDKQLIIFPGPKLGCVQILDLMSTDCGVSSSPVWIAAHDGEIACLAFNSQANKIATASDKGTLIRVWDITDKRLLYVLRRGMDVATIFCLNFSLNSDFLCCSSDKGTIHIFDLKTKGTINFLTGSLTGQRALANFTVPQECACICAFTRNNSVITACVDGTFHKYIFTQTGNCNRESFDVFLNIHDDDENLF